MTFSEFVKRFDFLGSFVLLEGKRIVKEEDKPKLTMLGTLLAHQTKHIVFRSGNATGADQYFSEGVARIDHTRLQVVVPYNNHRKKSNVAYNTVSLESIDLASEPDLVYYSKKHKTTEKLIDRYVSGERNKFSIKAAYILRDTVKVLGTSDYSPIVVGIFYDDLANPREGGTGHTMKTCTHVNTPVIDQTVWLNWLSGDFLFAGG